jgi:hypothetical protein
LHVDRVLKYSSSGNLINHFTVVLAAHASFVQVAVRRNSGKTLVYEVHGNVQTGARKLARKQFGVLRCHLRGASFLALHRPGQAYENLHGPHFRSVFYHHANIGVLLGVAAYCLERRGQDFVGVANGQPNPDGADVYPQLDALGVDAAVRTGIHR